MNKQLVSFNITGMDPLGQGVSRENGVTFIEKVLPGETGTAVVYRKAKGVKFAAVNEIVETSPLRISPECGEYHRCGGCQYLHTEYQTELDFKRDTLGKLTAGLFSRSDDIAVHPAESRKNYRNRVQLHYNLDKGELGYVSKFTSSLVPAGRCILPVKPVMEKIKRLYEYDNWKNLLPENAPSEGTVEIYLKPGSRTADIYWNKPYSSGGFSQINNKMNTVLRTIISEWHEKNSGILNPVVLDIFGGSGNLSGSIKNARTAVIDYIPGKNTGSDAEYVFVNMDLYRKDAVRNLYGKLKKLSLSEPDILIFDPPRRGIKDSDSWIRFFKARFIIYVSCNPATFRRDALTLVDEYAMDKLHLVDLFPGTRHFEIFSVFRKKVL